MAPVMRFFVFATAATLIFDRITATGFRGIFALSRAIMSLTTLLLVIWIIFFWLVYPKFFSPLRLLPGPEKSGNFFMGQFLLMRDELPGKTMQRWVAEIPNEGIIRYLDVFNSERILPVSPAALADVLVHRNYDFEKPVPLRKGISRILGMGMFLAEGEEHKRQRKTMMPAFAFRHVKEIYPIFWSKSKEMVDAVLKDFELNPSTGIEANDWASRATLDIIGEAGMGQSFNAIQDPTNPLNQTYRKIFKTSRMGAFLAVLGILLPQWVIRSLPIERNDSIRAASIIIRSTCFSLIAQKKAAMEKGTSGIDILSVALASGGFSDEDLVNQMMTFLAAGHETTASAMTWAIYVLCKHPEIQTRLRAEVLDRLGSQLRGDAPIASEMIDQSTYLQAFCIEVLRLYPPVSFTIREAVVPTRILNTPIPKGATVILAPWAVNTSVELWGPDAQIFKPERWLNSPSGGAEGNYSFLTFLHGPRSCIGQRFAVAELACLVAAWVGRMDVELVDKDKALEVRGGITTKPEGGLWVKVREVSEK